MHGLNKLFMMDPVEFLRRYPLRVQKSTKQGIPFSQLYALPNPPVLDFDLRWDGGGVQLIPFETHPKTHRFGTQRPIRAYWLDYAESQSRIVSAPWDQADYLFTPMLDGCYIGINNTGIVHVAGNVKGAKGGTQAMRQIAATALGGNRISIGFDSAAAHAMQCTLVGLRGATGWSWYVQGHGIFHDKHGAAQGVFNGGQHVIRITDLTHG